MKRIINVKVNDQDYEAAVDCHKTLLEFIRDDLCLTGTKEGCGEGACGACTVVVDGEAVNSCLMLAVDADGKSITTIEGLSSVHQLHPLQQAFVDAGAVQCGFCTPGFIMSAFALLKKNPKPTEQEIKEAVSGNICRCTGYARIIDAITTASQTMNVDNNQ